MMNVEWCRAAADPQLFGRKSTCSHLSVAVCGIVADQLQYIALSMFCGLMLAAFTDN